MYTGYIDGKPAKIFYDDATAQPFPELKDRLEMASRGIPLPDMSYPADAPEGTMPLLPENDRGVEPADLYEMQQKAERRFARIRHDIEKRISKGR